MIRPFELAIGLRYTRSRRRSHFISFITAVSIAGLTLGIAVLILVLSVMNGFGKELRARILSAISHVTIAEPRGVLADWPMLARELAGDPMVRGLAPYIAGQGLLARGQHVTGVEVRGILPAEEATVSEFHAKMVLGELGALKPGEYGIVIGSTIAWKLDLSIGSSVTLVIPQAQASPVGLLPRFKRFVVVGIFRLDQHQYDSALALIHLDDARTLYHLPAGAVSGLRLKLDDLDAAPRVAQALEERLGGRYVVRDWTREHSAFFQALKMEKTVMFIILLCIIVVAIFNLVASLVVIVTEKRADIAILRTLGASPRSILGIFMVQGALIGLLGTAVGTLTGVVLALNVEAIVQTIERLLGVRFLSPQIYFLSELPSDLQWLDVVLVAGSALAISLLATLYPAWRASQVQPAEALRYE
jgi:lipoprotein-releasing system permease protein